MKGIRALGAAAVLLAGMAGATALGGVAAGQDCIPLQVDGDDILAQSVQNQNCAAIVITSDPSQTVDVTGGDDLTAVARGGDQRARQDAAVATGDTSNVTLSQQAP